MITKILKPSGSGKVVYDNKGSCARLVNYLAHEARPQGKEVTYFNGSRDDLTAAQVTAAIDGNCKGVRKEDAKFYSLIISPSADELKHSGNDPEKLRAYTGQVMENYARNFGLKDGRKLEGKDLVWFATFHQGREYNGFDQQVREGTAKAGVAKPGLQTHIHVVVSRRDAAQQVTLTPTGRRERFCIQDWQKQNAKDFKHLFGYQKQTYFDKAESKEQHLRNRLEKLAKAEGLESRYLNPDRVVLAAKEAEFNWKFYRNLRSLEHTLRSGVRPPDPYAYLEAEVLTAIRKQKAGRMLTQGTEAGPAQKAAELKQSRLFRGEGLREPVAKEEQKGEKQADRQAAPAGERIGQLASFFKNLSRSATIAHGEEEWVYQPKKHKLRRRRHDQGRGREQ
jgi:hypothetical protein